MKKTILLAAAAILTTSFADAQTLRLPHELFSGGAESLDPISPARFFEVGQTVYSRLVRQGYDGGIAPDLATEWSATPDAKRWTFKLRQGVSFHNGNAFTAEDVVFSLMRTQSEAIDSPTKGGLSIIEEVEALDPHTAVITLKSSHADFPILLMDYRIRMLDAETCNNDRNELCESGVGTGPFKVVSVDPVGITVLERFEGYWEGPAKVEKVEIIGIADQQARVAALQAGQIDVVLSITGQQSALFKGNDNFVVQPVATGRWLTLAMNTTMKPFDDARVRKALRILADRDSIGKLVFGEGGYTVACDNPVWSGDQYRAELSCAKDVEQAKALLAEAGYPDGIDVELFASDITEGLVRMAEIYQVQAKEAGVNVKLSIAPADGYWADTWMKNAFVGSSWSQRPADQILNEAYRTGSAWNETFWNVPAFDAKLDEARQTLDLAARKKVYGELQEMLFEEGGSFVPLHQKTMRVISSKLSGLPEVEDFTIRFQDISKAD